MIGRRRLDEELARRSLGRFASHVQSSLEHTVFHRNYYRLLDEFARGRIRRLMVSVPPQHGKSMGASQLLPAYLLGIDPDLRVCIGSYSFSLARRFGLGVQRIIGSDPYRGVFPATFLKGMNSAASGGNSIRTADEFDIVDANGGLRLVGCEGSLTGSRVDVMILDDLYKDHMEANSPLVRDNTWKWYTSVVRTRMHNRSREAVVFTRWHGVIAEFSIRMGDDGAVLYQGGELDTGFSKETTGQDSSVRGQAVSEEQTVSKTSESESSGGETASVTVDSDENRRTSVAKTSTDSSSDEETTVTTDGDESRTTTVSKTSSGESSDRTVSEKSGQTDVTDNKSSSLSVSERSGRSSREFRPATDAQRNLIMRRSLADADVLLAKAVRYMVRHADLFPGFDPREVRPAGIITGFSTLDSGGLWK